VALRGEFTPEGAPYTPAPPIRAPSRRALFSVPFPPTVLRTTAHKRAYAPRILGATVASLALLLAAFRLWPAAVLPPPRPLAAAPPAERVVIEEVVPTRQEAAAVPPPPALVPPVAVPDDLPPPPEVPDLDLPLAPVPERGTAPTPAAPTLPTAPTAPAASGPTFVEEAEVRPQVIRTVVPDYPAEAERRRLRARVTIRVLVDEGGQVREAEVVERIRVDGRDREERVAELGFGIEEAALAAARQLRFRPGRHEGRAVRTYTVVTLRVGV